MTTLRPTTAHSEADHMPNIHLTPVAYGALAAAAILFPAAILLTWAA